MQSAFQYAPAPEIRKALKNLISMLKEEDRKESQEIIARGKEFFDKKIFLDLFVKVSKDWREQDNQLKKFGYDAMWGNL